MTSGGTFAQFLLLQHAERGTLHGTAQGIAAESAAMVSRLENAHDFPRREDGGNRVEAARERIADNHHIRLDSVVHVSEKFAGAAEARLNFIGDQKHAILVADIGGLLQESRRRND